LTRPYLLDDPLDSQRLELGFKPNQRVETVEAGETIHTENSHKYSHAVATLLLRAAGWSPMADWTDDKDLFSILLCEATPEPSAP
jgi:L-histidine Nalpha-methyltransferase